MLPPLPPLKLFGVQVGGGWPPLFLHLCTCYTHLFFSIPFKGKKRVLSPKMFNSVVSAFSYHLNLVIEHQQICRCMLKFCQIDKISFCTCIFGV